MKNAHDFEEEPPYKIGERQALWIIEIYTMYYHFTRSRPYHKNDNPHVEEKNNSVIRTFVGYDRHDNQGEEGLLNRLYVALHLMVNWFLPSQKLLHKVKTWSHITKVYDNAQTLARMDVSEETKRRLLATRAALDMTTLFHEILLPRGCCCIRGVYWPGPTG